MLDANGRVEWPIGFSGKSFFLDEKMQAHTHTHTNIAVMVLFERIHVDGEVN